MKRFFGTLVIAIAGGLIAAGAMHVFGDKQPVTIIETVTEPAPVTYSNLPASTEALDFTHAAEKTVNAVVHVKTEAEVDGVYNPWFDFFGYENNETQIQRGSGSGVIISDDGYIVTNNHVIEGAQKITVSLNDNKVYDAEVIGADPGTDIALIKVNAERLPSVTFGNSDNVRIGQWVLAVGNPFDLTSTVTAGIVSAKARNINLLQGDANREIFPIESFIQTDAAVNPGNSGGALVNTNGELIGINTAIASRTGSYSGYSFAVPSSIVSKVAADLKEFGVVQRAFIGVRITEVNQELAEATGLDKIEGVYVSDLVASGAAAEAGIEPGDVILKVGSSDVKTVPELQEQISRYRPGDEVGLAVWRDGQIERVAVTLRNKDGNTELRDAPEVETMQVLGASFEEVSDGQKAELEIHGGAVISDVGRGKLRDSGVKNGFIVTKIDGKKVYDTDDLIDVLTDKSGGVLIEGVYPNGQKAYYGFGM
ncbi:Do family serine endopeptidase [Sanyastnella coralliicola]|uniref:Do family serine endopeptidase n=1 Tax=Sanyastnella coralliicola TaxID=3069118 RepID=UPI0027BAE9C3|nr:Do family serine endopeptidase [Longitalea sp. SCSIO 12813]